MKNKTSLKQILSTGLSLALVAASSPMPASAFGPVEAAAPAFAATFTPPERFGYVSSSYTPNKDEKAPRLIMISDLHSQVEVQHNIVGILHDVVNKLNPAPGHKVPIFVEGGWERNLEEPLKDVANPQVRAFLGEYLLQKSQIGAAQAFSEEIAGSNKVSLIGVENKAEYDANSLTFVKSYPVRKRLLQALAREERAMKQLSKYIANGSFEKLQTMRDDYNAGRIGADRYAKGLSHQAARFHITGHPVDVLNNWENAKPNDLEVAFAQVYQAVALHVAKGAPWTAFLRKSLGNEETMRANIARFDSDFDLLKRLVSNQLTPGEVPLALARMAYLQRMAGTLVSDAEVGMNVQDVVQHSLDFYPYALLRDKTLIENSLKELNATHDPEATGILIVGGFHADSMMEYLRNHGVSYLHINPTVTRDMTTEEQINYAKRLAKEPVSEQEFKEDLSLLAKSNGKKALNGSAIGPAANDADPSTPKAMGGDGLARLLPLGDIEGQLAVLRSRGANPVAPGTRTSAEGVSDINALREAAEVAGTLNTDPSAAARVSNLLGKVDAWEAETPGNGIQGLTVYQDRSFTLVADANGKYVAETGKTLSKEQQAIADKINTLQKGEAAAPVLDIFIAPDEAQLAMKAEARTFTQGVGEKRAAIVFTEAGVNPLTDPNADHAAVNQALHVVSHEGSHAVNTGRQEGKTLVYGWIQGAVMAGASFDVGSPERTNAILQYINDTLPQIGLYEGEQDAAAFVTLIMGTTPRSGQFRSRLAESIALVMAGPNLSDEQIVQIKQHLEQEFPEVPEYLIAKSLDKAVHGVGAVAMGEILDPNGKPVEKAAEEEAAADIAPKAEQIMATGTSD